MPPAAPPLCAVCRRIEAGVGWAPRGRGRPGRIVFTCAADIDLGEAVGMKRRDEMAVIEREALRAGGDRAGQFLDGLGRTDLAKLSEEEWATFLEHVLDGYGEAVRERLQVRKGQAQ